MDNFSIDIKKATPYCSVECPHFELEDASYHYVFNTPVHNFRCKNEHICEYMYSKMKDEGKSNEA